MVLVRASGQDTMHSRHIIKGSCAVFGDNVMRLMAKKLEISDARRVFDEVQPKKNRSSQFGLDFGAILESGGVDDIASSPKLP